MRLAIIGSGFAGAILARVARAQGHAVALVERGRHPRFALGESSTPLAALALERLAARYGLADLDALAAWGRWGRTLPHLGRGLKRGFTFYRHEPGEPFGAHGAGAARLLVAASPDDAIADAHWKRADVDAHLVARAVAEGADYREATALTAVESLNGAVRLRLERGGRADTLDVDMVVDASGEAGAAVRHLGAGDTTPAGLRTALVFGHFEDVAPIGTVLPAGVRLAAGPYPDERAAVHHLIDEGWVYELRFDDGVVSAGIVIEHGAAGAPAPGTDLASAFHAILARYPTLAAQYDNARPLGPVAGMARLQRQRTPAAGPTWAALPHTVMFWSPMFSTGIAWSLLAVERLGLLLEGGRGPLAAGLARYGDLVATEAAHVRALVEAAYRARRHFALFDATSQAYFAAASFEEARQRLVDSPRDGWAWQGFLGATDPVTREMVAGVATLAGHDPRGLPAAASALIARRNVAGLADADKRGLYGVDLEALVAAAPLLGLSAGELRHRLPRLRAGG